jgi:hypothetical protein
VKTPRAAAAAGVLFAVLFATALILIRTTLPEHAEAGTPWLAEGAGRLRIAALLMPFAGISFLWFIGVVRDGFGHLEDRFFSSVFLGSGLLFLAMMFASTAVGVGLGAGGEGVVHPNTPTKTVPPRPLTPRWSRSASWYCWRCPRPTRCGWRRCS